jgi:hypothetical protein
MNHQNNWKLLSRFVEIKSPWLTLIGEKLEDNQNNILDYWRVEKADSVIILTLQNNQLLLPKPVYRPGIGQITLDFPGGRLPEDQQPIEVVSVILKRELGVEQQAIAQVTPLNATGWAINSSFSNQKLYSFVAEIDANFTVNPQYLGKIYQNTPQEINRLLQDLTCLQCRYVLLEWLRMKTEL